MLFAQAEKALDYIALGRRGQWPLVVSPTHAESAKVTEAIREAKMDARQLGAEKEFIRYHSLQWAEVDRSLPENYQPGLLVQFHQNSKGIDRTIEMIDHVV